VQEGEDYDLTSGKTLTLVLLRLRMVQRTEERRVNKKE